MLLSSSLLTRNATFNFAITSLLACILTFSESFAATTKVEIRFAVAQSAFRENFDDNQPFASRTETGAYDILWRGELVNGSFRASQMKVLFGNGSTQNNYKIGGGTCTGTLSTTNRNFAPTSSMDSKGKVTMSIDLPSIAANNGVEAFLMDKGQPQFSTCNFVSTELESATCFNPTRDCFTIGGSITPVVALSNEPTPFSKFLNRKDRAYFTFNAANPNVRIPITYSVNDTVVDHLGKTTNIYKIVYAGFVTVTTSVGTVSPPPVNPNTFISPTFTDPPPPSNPFTGPSGDVVTAVVNLWLKAFGPVVKEFSKTVQNLNNVPVMYSRRAGVIARRAIVPVTGTTFNSANGKSSISTDAIGITPATGKLQVKFKALPPDKARGFKLTIPSNASGTKLVKDQVKTIPFTIDRDSLKLLKSKKAAKVFFTVRLSPTGSKKVFEKQFSFDLKAVKK